MNKQDKERLFDTLDKISDRVGNLEITAAKHDANLEEHMKRTALAEESIALIRQELKPVEKHVYFVEAIIKVIGVTSALVSIGVGIFKIISLFL